MTTATIKKWADFQHYKNRCPPWIKLQKSILDDFEFACLPIASKALAPLLWLLASESMDGSVRIDPDWLAFRLRFTVSDIEDGLTPLIDKGFLVLAGGVLAPRLQDACLEGEGEAEGEAETDSSEANASGDEPPSDPPADPLWGTGLAFLMRKGIPEKPARGLLGKVKHALGDAEAARILGDAETQDVSDPAPWLLKAIASAKARAGPGKGKPSIAQNFSAKTYTGTPDNELPDFLRAGTA